MRSLLNFVLLLLIRIATSEEKTSCIEIEKGFTDGQRTHEKVKNTNINKTKSQFSANLHLRRRWNFQQFRIFNWVCFECFYSLNIYFVFRCESAPISTISSNLSTLNGTSVGRLTIRDAVVNTLPLDVFDNVRILRIGRIGHLINKFF